MAGDFPAECSQAIIDCACALMQLALALAELIWAACSIPLS